MIDLPKIRLPNGQLLKATKEASTPTSGSEGTRDAKLPPIPNEIDNVSLDLSSAIVYIDSADDVSFSLSDQLSGTNLDEIKERTDIPVEIPFSVGSAQFEFTSLILFPETFALVYEPVNENAESKVFAGGLSGVALSDDQEGTYENFLSGGFVEHGRRTLGRVSGTVFPRIAEPQGHQIQPPPQRHRRN